ncbi:MAG: hypothetical protein DRI24_05185 [Deltaproteobacteria bacterium]|nr:MAG: hypothetical protein DRI24_05185 [Deltaproteobacteria bacterium]RLE05690.1 MAG: hypothetical protein DRJ13_01520 [Bacteroidota bacterium]
MYDYYHNRLKLELVAPALDRGIDVIELLASSSNHLSFSEIQDALPIPRASLYGFSIFSITGD